MNEQSLPPFEIEEVFDLYNKNTVKQTIGWGLIQSKIPDAWIHGEGEGISLMVIDTGKPQHEDINPPHNSRIINNSIVETFSKDNPLDRNFVEGEDIYDSNGHHTHCAGIICAQNNEKGMVGVAPKIKLISVKVLDKNGRGSSNNLLAALQYALEVKPDIVSMSLGSSSSDPRIENVVKELYGQNIPLVCAAGNSGNMGVNFPGAYKETISVAAYDKFGNIAGFSSKGPEVDWAAPGVSIYSTFLNNQYAKLNGTSMACPFIAGVIALMLSKHRKMEKLGRHNNCKTVEEIRQHLLRCSNDKGAIGKDNSWGFGVVDVLKLLNIDNETPEPTPEPEPEPEPDKKKNWLKKNFAWIPIAIFIPAALILFLSSKCSSNEIPEPPYINKDGSIDWDKKFDLDK